jgi:predicted Fe-Mo cluster-binding NifX family protein
MKICIPTVDDGGLDARISDHFGSAPFYTLVDSETGLLKTLRNTHHGHGQGHGHQHGACRALNHTGPDDCDAVACRGLGRGAIASLGRSGLKVYAADGAKVGDVVEAARNGSLRRPSEEEILCGGRRQHGRGGGGCR